MIDPFKLLKRLKHRRAVIDHLVSARPTSTPGLDQIAIIDASEIGPGRLVPDLLPEQVWGSNLRGILSRQDWDRLRMPVCERARNCCEVCGDTAIDPASGRARRPDCHERWSFEIHGNRFVQRISGLIALCPGCHRCQHVGLAEVRGELDLVRAKLAEVNRWNSMEVQIALDQAVESYRGRLGFSWDLDLSHLKGVVTVPGFPDLLISAGQRSNLGNSFWHP